MNYGIYWGFRIKLVPDVLHPYGCHLSCSPLALAEAGDGVNEQRRALASLTSTLAWSPSIPSTSATLPGQHSISDDTHDRYGKYTFFYL